MSPMIRQRAQGHRRRGSLGTLVRTRPALTLEKNPPLPGYFSRTMKAESITDTSGLSTASWSVGTTGDYSGAGSSYNCLYHHYTTTDRRTESVWNILNPIRWSFDGPASSGGSYSWIVSPGGGRQELGFDLYATSPASFPIHEFPAGNSILCASSHGSVNQYVQIENTNLMLPLGNLNFPNMLAISGLPLWAIERAQVYAIQHRVNGSAVGSVIENPLRADFRVNCDRGDTYELDVWYRIGTIAKLLYPSGPGKAFATILTTKVSTGSRRHNLDDQNRNRFTFSNINYTPDFDYTKHSYEITAVGHSGWTLKNGTDGPHAMITDGDWITQFDPSFLLWRKAFGDNGWVKSIQIIWNGEIPSLQVFVGVYMQAALGSSSYTRLLYRPANSGDYITSMTSPDHGSFGLSPVGAFSQSGTTTWNLVESTVASPNYPQYTNAYKTPYLAPPLPMEVPTSFVTTRITR